METFSSDSDTAQNGLVTSSGLYDISPTKRMSDQATEIEFSLDDVVGHRPVTPDTVDLPTLRSFLEEIEIVIKGDVPGASLADSRVRIENGSLKVVAFVARSLAADFSADLVKLEETGDLDVIQPKRAQIIERWQQRTRRSPQRTYAVGTAHLRHCLRITNSTRFQHGSENAWITVEKHLTGKVVDLGGKQDPNVHLVLTDRAASVRVAATEQQLSAEKENQLYETVTLRVQGEQHLRTKELRSLRLMQLLPQTSEADEQALASLWEKGRKAWKNVTSAADWVESLRGNQ